MRINAGDTGEASIEDNLFVSYAASYEHDGDVMLLCALQDAKR